MAALTTQLGAFLKTKTSVTILVSTRIWSTHIPQTYDFATGPAISMTKISDFHYQDLRKSSGIAEARVQIDFWATNEDEADAIAEAVRLILQAYSGTIGTTEVLAVELDDVNNLPEEPTDGSNVWIQHIACDYLIVYRNAKAPA